MPIGCCTAAGSMLIKSPSINRQFQPEQKTWTENSVHFFLSFAFRIYVGVQRQKLIGKTDCLLLSIERKCVRHLECSTLARRPNEEKSYFSVVYDFSTWQTLISALKSNGGNQQVKFGSFVSVACSPCRCQEFGPSKGIHSKKRISIAIGCRRIKFLST